MQSLYKLTPENLRIERIWPLPNGECPESMLDFIEEQGSLPVSLTELLGWDATAEWYQDIFKGSHDEDSEAIWDELFYSLKYRLKKAGLLAEIHRPVMSYRADGSVSFSWGRYHIFCFFGETIDSIVEQAIAWAKATDEAGFARAREATNA